MKKLKVLLLFLLLVPISVFSKVCDSDNVIVKSVELKSLSDGMEEKEQPVVSENNISLNLVMGFLGDTAEYKVTIKNDSDEGYELDNKIISTSNYIEYSLESEDDSYIVKGNSEKEVVLKVQYKTEVPEDSFSNGKYNDNSTIAISLVNNNNENNENNNRNDNPIVNPKTGNYIILGIFIVLLIGISSYMILKGKKVPKTFIFIMLMIPLMINAICTKNINIESSIQIKAKPKYILMNGTKTNSSGKYFETNIKRNQIESITFSNKTDNHIVNDTDCFDVSLEKDGSVLAWVEDSDSDELYEMTIGANGIIEASDAKFLFYNLPYLESINNLQYLDTSKATSAREMFSGDSSLTSLDLSYMDTSSITNMFEMFQNCKKLTQLDLSHFDTSNVTTMQNIFQQCIMLESIDLSHFNTNSLTNMTGMFIECTSLTTLDLSYFNTSKVTSMYSLFYGCQSLSSLNLLNWDTSQVIYMTFMFQNCQSLQSLDLSHFDTSKVTDMKQMFYNCSSLKSLNLSNWKNTVVTDMSSMFNACSQLEALNLSGFKTPNVTNMSKMFSDCYKIISLNLSEFDTSKVTDMSSMFYHCIGLTTLDISSFETDSVTNMSSMFYSCSHITNMDLSHFDTSKVIDMHDMFGSCLGLVSLNISNFDTSKVTNMLEMFDNCRRLVSLDLMSFNTSQVTTMHRMFYNCYELRKIYASSYFTTANVTNSIGMFHECRSLVGGNDTAYNVNHTDASYAHLDEAPTNPGYFSLLLI